MAGLLAGALLGFVSPWRVPVPAPLRLGLGGGLVLAGLVVVAAAVRAAGPKRLEDRDSPLAAGPYRYSRHPMYVGWTALYLGLALAADLVWPLALLPAVAAAISRTVRREEAALESRFGDDYRAYAASVPRYL